MQELKRMKQKLAAAAGSSSAGASSSPPSCSLLLLQQQASKASAATLSMPAAGAGLPQRRLPSISDSETLPTEVDRALWEEQHQQTLQQQEFQRQVSKSFPSASSNSPAAAAAGSAGAPAVGTPGAAAAGAYNGANAGAAGGPVRTVSGQQLLQQMQRMQLQEDTGGSSMYVDDSHMEQSGQQRVYNTNVHSTMCWEDSPLVLLSGLSTTVDDSRMQSQTHTELQ
jgi:hypothetical protein